MSTPVRRCAASSSRGPEPAQTNACFALSSMQALGVLDAPGALCASEDAADALVAVKTTAARSHFMAL